MDVMKTTDEWKVTLMPALESKANEFRMMGYNNATSEDVWKCLEKKVWKENPTKRLYDIIQDVLHLSTNIYMSYLTINAYQNDDLAASIAALTENDDVETD